MSKKALYIDYFDTNSSRKFHLPISVFKRPTSAKEYANLENVLDELIDVVRGNGEHPLAEVMQIIGDNMEQYDNENFFPSGTNISDIE